MKKRVFHGKVNDVSFDDRDAMLNYLKDLADHNEPVTNYSSYYEVYEDNTEDADTNIQHNVIADAVKQLDITNLEVDNLFEEYEWYASDELDDELSNRMSNFLSIMDVATDIEAISDEYSKIQHDAETRFAKERVSIDSLYEEVIRHEGYLCDKMNNICSEIQARAARTEPQMRKICALKELIEKLDELKEQKIQDESQEKKLKLYSKMYDSILGWLGAMSDIIENYKTRNF